MAHLPLTGVPYLIRKTVSSPGTAEQLASVTLGDGFPATFKNRLSNTGNVYLAKTAAAAQSSSGVRRVLEPGESVEWAIQNLNQIYVDADDSTSVLEISYTLTT